jgi:hypothetical protein
VVAEAPQDVAAPQPAAAADRGPLKESQ